MIHSCELCQGRVRAMSLIVLCELYAQPHTGAQNEMYGIAP